MRISTVDLQIRSRISNGNDAASHPANGLNHSINLPAWIIRKFWNSECAFDRHRLLFWQSDRARNCHCSRIDSLDECIVRRWASLQIERCRTKLSSNDDLVYRTDNGNRVSFSLLSENASGRIGTQLAFTGFKCCTSLSNSLISSNYLHANKHAADKPLSSALKQKNCLLAAEIDLWEAIANGH